MQYCNGAKYGDESHSNIRHPSSNRAIQSSETEDIEWFYLLLLSRGWTPFKVCCLKFNFHSWNAGPILTYESQSAAFVMKCTGTGKVRYQIYFKKKVIRELMNEFENLKID